MKEKETHCLAEQPNYLAEACQAGKHGAAHECGMAPLYASAKLPSQAGTFLLQLSCPHRQVQLCNHCPILAACFRASGALKGSECHKPQFFKPPAHGRQLRTLCDEWRRALLSPPKSTGLFRRNHGKTACLSIQALGERKWMVCK
eukprot:1160185-Pelagomonas_calceolata.AAC.2